MLNCQYFDTSYRDSLVLNILIHRFARFVDHVAQIRKVRRSSCRDSIGEYSTAEIPRCRDSGAQIQTYNLSTII